MMVQLPRSFWFLETLGEQPKKLPSTRLSPSVILCHSRQQLGARNHAQKRLREDQTLQRIAIQAHMVTVKLPLGLHRWPGVRLPKITRWHVPQLSQGRDRTNDGPNRNETGALKRKLQEKQVEQEKENESCIADVERLPICEIEHPEDWCRKAAAPEHTFAVKPVSLIKRSHPRGGEFWHGR